MRTRTMFDMFGDRGKYSAKCKGWATMVTSQDCPCYGSWVNIKTKKLVTFAEGDVTVMTADNGTEFVAMIRKHEDWERVSGGRLGIVVERHREAWESLGLGDLLI